MKQYFRYIGAFLMVFSFLVGFLNISYYLGASTTIITQFFIFLLGLILFGHSYILKGTNADRVDHRDVGARIIYIPLVVILGALVYSNYSPSQNMKQSEIEEGCVMNGLGEGTCTFKSLGEKKSEVVPVITNTIETPVAEIKDEKSLPKKMNITFGQILKGLPFTMDKGCDTECDEVARDIGAIYMGDDQKPNDYEKGLIRDANITITCGNDASVPCRTTDKIFEATLAFAVHQSFMLTQDKKNMGNAYKYDEDAYFYERDMKYLVSFIANVFPTEDSAKLAADGISSLKNTPETGGADYIELGRYFSQDIGDIKLEWFKASNRPYFSVTVKSN